MEPDDPINITDPEGIAILLAVAAVYLGIRLLPRIIVGFRSFISASEVQRRIEAGEDLLLVDVRSPGEFTGELGHIRGALNMPLSELTERLNRGAAALGSHDRAVVTICRSDARAAFAVHKLRRAGFTQVLVMSGGMLGWLADDLPVEHDDPNRGEG